jgi:tetratricopeptide (TPR) repeat protein
MIRPRPVSLRSLLPLAAFALVLSGFPAGIAAAETADGRIAPLLEGLGDHHHPISSEDPMARRYFDQALVLTFNFNHAEAERSFREAARRDPQCAICWWGVALVLGPNPNSAMEDDAVAPAWEALQKARSLAPQASESERAYIEALATRYVEQPLEDRSALDRAYADAMRELVRRYPDDTDAATFFTEALMVTTPWDYWREDGEPREVTEEMIGTLEAVLAADPGHPGANHLYIHVLEAERPQLAAEAADRLRELVPGAGHLLHMPSHVYIRVGRYHEAVEANRIAIAADDSYATQCHAQGLYPLAYMPHNRHFLWAAATLGGDSSAALQAAREIADKTDHGTMRETGLETLQHFWATPLYALVRFGRWDELLETPEPGADLIYPRGVWHYGRAMALIRSGRLDEAAAELESLAAIAADPRLEEITVWDINTTAALLAIARSVVAGELAAARGDFETAILELELGAALEDGLNYDEPPPWHAPVRHNLGAVYLAAGRPESAERVYREDLEVFPENGWALYGLEESLRAQSRPAEADETHDRFAEAWAHADVELTSSRF